MPHKPSVKSAGQVQFVSVSLTVELKKQLGDWARGNESSILELLEDVVQSGYRFSVKEEEVGYVASLSFVRAQGPNSGLVLMERGGTPTRALLRLLWAHTAHFKLIWPKEARTAEDDW